MGNYENLKQSITEVIRTNGNQEITGAVLQNTLLTIISTVGANASFAGIATPTTNPGTPDGPVFYLASESGAYPNFGGIELQDGLSVLMWNGSWSSQLILSSNRFGYNVTVFGLVTGVHTLATAVKNVPLTERFGGQKITFKTDSGWVTYQNTSLDISDYENVTNWVLDSGVSELGDVTITNNPDYEDLTQNEGGQLKFADKTYNAATYTGLGRKYLRKNIVGGVNILTQDMLADANTIYHIQYDYTLGENITIPENCILEFDGGSINSNLNEKLYIDGVFIEGVTSPNQLGCKFEGFGNWRGYNTDCDVLINRYVSIAGSDENGDGTKLKPFKTINYALNAKGFFKNIVLGAGTHFLREDTLIARNLISYEGAEVTIPAYIKDAYSYVESGIQNVVYYEMNTNIIGGAGANLAISEGIGFLQDVNNDVFFGSMKFQISDLTTFGDFYYDEENLRLYFYKDRNFENGALLYLGVDTYAIGFQKNSKIEGIRFKNYAGNCVNLAANTVVKNCSFENIGGGKYGNNDRYGNGIQIFLGGEYVDNVTITNNYFYNIYDVAVTIQTWNQPTVLGISNFYCAYNIMDRCAQGIGNGITHRLRYNNCVYEFNTIKNCAQQKFDRPFPVFRIAILNQQEDGDYYRCPIIRYNTIINSIPFGGTGYGFSNNIGDTTARSVAVYDNTVVVSKDTPLFYDQNTSSYVYQNSNKDISLSDSLKSNYLINNTKIILDDFSYIKYGASTERPWCPAYDMGHSYFDTTLGKPIWWNGTNWVDATGATV